MRAASHMSTRFSSGASRLVNDLPASRNSGIEPLRREMRIPLPDRLNRRGEPMNRRISHFAGEPLRRLPMRRAVVVVVMLLGSAAGLAAAHLCRESVAAWNRYVSATEARIAAELKSPRGFLALDFAQG